MFELWRVEGTYLLFCKHCNHLGHKEDNCFAKTKQRETEGENDLKSKYYFVVNLLQLLRIYLIEKIF